SARQRRERLGHRRGEREMKDGDVALRCRGIRKGADVIFQVLVDRERKEIRLVPLRAQHVANFARAVADRIPLVRRRYPLVDDHLVAGAEEDAKGAEGFWGSVPAGASGSARYSAGRN